MVGVPVRRPPAPVRRCACHRRLHQRPSAQALVAEASDAIRCGGCRRSPGASRLALRQRQRLPVTSPASAPSTTAAADCSLRRHRRRPFRREASSPQVRTSAFVARPSDLRHLPLAARASRLFVRSPWQAPPRIGFLFVGPRVRYPLPPDPHSRSGPCGVASVPTARSREDLHLRVDAHAGRTNDDRAPRRTSAPRRKQRTLAKESRSM